MILEGLVKKKELVEVNLFVQINSPLDLLQKVLDGKKLLDA